MRKIEKLFILTQYDIKLILILYYFEELSFNEIHNKIGGSKEHLNERLKRLIYEGIIIKKDSLYSLSNKGKNIAEMLIEDIRIDLLKYHFIEKFKIFISLLKYISIPFIYKFKISFFKGSIVRDRVDELEKILREYCIAFLYVEAISEKIADSKEEIINNIENVWKNIEKPIDKIFNIKNNWDNSIKKLLEELDSMKIETDDIKREIIEYFKERINKNKERLFKDLKDFSRNPNEYFLKIPLNFYEKASIGIISGVIVTIIFSIICIITSYFILSLFNIVTFTMLFVIIAYGLFLIFIGPIIIYICDKLPMKGFRKRIINTIIFSSLSLLMIFYEFSEKSLLIEFIKFYVKIFPYLSILMHIETFLLLIFVIAYNYLFIFINEKITLKYIKLKYHLKE
jgi:DNA-binding Lrp family transcriptional regulator